MASKKEEVVIRCHHDADGIISAYFLSFAVPNANIEIWGGDFGDTTGLKKGDWMVDMRPNTNMEGLNVIDHHLPHPYDEIKYNLTGEEVPASYITWKKYKEDIPKSEWWKLAIGLVGDGQPELIPTEVFDTCPTLLSKVKTSAYQSYGSWKMSYYPVYKLLSSYVNSHLRRGENKEALDLVKFSQNPINVLSSTKAQKSKSYVKSSFENCIKSCNSYEFDNLAVFIFSSEDVRLSGYIASTMQSALSGKTVLALNRMSGRGSLRGDLAYYWRDKLKHLEYLIIDGHPGFCGVSCTVNPDTLVEDLMKGVQ